MPEVILVDKKDQKTGTKDKLQAHKDNNLHRAFSVFLFNSDDELLLQQRALGKYHSAGLWSNTCCSHPKPNEGIIESGKRRLNEELGIDAPELTNLFTFRYQIDLENVNEHEMDHVLAGRKDELSLSPDPKEVRDYKWVYFGEMLQKVSEHPDNFTYWFRKILNEHEGKLRDYLKN